jgi:hypothetical protein
MPPQKETKLRQKPDDELWFTIQTSTELDKRSAERRINKQRDKGYDAYCTEVMQNGRQLYKIRFGRYASAKEAGDAAETYNVRERRNCMVVKIVSGIDVASSGDRGPAAKKQEQALGSDRPEQERAETAAQPAATAAAALAQNPNPTDPAELPEEARIRQPGEATQPAAAEPGQIERPPAVEMPSEPEPQAERTLAADAEGATAPAADAEASQKEPLRQEEPPVADEPERMTSIYAYRVTSGALNLTNRYEDIPEELRKNIDYISLFPARIRDIAKNSFRMTLDVQGERKEIILAGLAISDKSESARAYLAALGTSPLRLKYNPWLSAKDGAIAGRLYLKEGSYVNLDMVRKGLGKYDAATLAPDQQEAFRQAQEAAKREHAGIWQ